MNRSVWNHQYISGQRIGKCEILRLEATAWSADVRQSRRVVVWQMKINEARYKLKSVCPMIQCWQTNSCIFESWLGPHEIEASVHWELAVVARWISWAFNGGHPCQLTKNQRDSRAWKRKYHSSIYKAAALCKRKIWPWPLDRDRESDLSVHDQKCR